MDGTVADYTGAMKQDMAKIASPDDLPYKDFDDDAPEYIRARRKMIVKQPEWWYNLPMLPLGMAVVNIFRELKFHIHILTKGPHTKPEAWSQKAEWCLRHIPDAMINITEDKGLFYGKVLMDDYPDYVERWLEWRPRGFVIMPAYDYNEHFQHPNVFRLHNMEQMDELRAKLKEIRKTCDA
jgi:hypothetical protein